MYGRWVLGLGEWLKGVMREDKRRKGELPKTEEASLITRAPTELNPAQALAAVPSPFL